MANLLCPCGAILSNGTIPNPIEHWLLSNETEPADGEDADDFRERICEVSRSVWRCPMCKRMAVFEPGKNDATWYEPIGRFKESKTVAVEGGQQRGAKRLLGGVAR